MSRQAWFLFLALILPSLLPGGGVEGEVRAVSDAALWVEGAGRSEFLFPDPVPTLSGMASLKELRPGDAIRAECDGSGPVRHCDFLEAVPPLGLPAKWLVTMTELRRLQEEGAAIVLWDVRPPAEFGQGHLPGARRWEEDADPPVPVPGALVVLYGRSDRDPSPHRALRAVLRSGGGEARVLRDGAVGWDRAGFPLEIGPGGLAGLVKAEPVIVVDVRSEGERKGGTLPDAYAIPVEEMDWKIFSDPSGMPALVFYGANGLDRRPREAAEQALRWRVSPGSGADGPVLILGGGVEAWSRMGFPLDDAPPRTTIVLSDHLPEGSVPPERFREWLDGPPADRILVDLRTKGSLPVPGTLQIPMEELPGRLGELPRDKTLTLFCSAGRRAAVAREMLRLLGYRAEYLRAPFVNP